MVYDRDMLALIGRRGSRRCQAVLWSAALGLAALIAAPSAYAGKERINGTTPARPTVTQAQASPPSQRIPGHEPRAVPAPTPADLSRVGPPSPNLPREFLPIPDRWRLADQLGVTTRWWDPYNQNTLKADRPLPGFQEFFFNLALISDTIYEPRRVPTPISGSGSQKPGANDQFGDGKQQVFVENLVVSLSLIEGDTAYRPPDFEVRLTPVFQYNRAEVEEVGVLQRDVRTGTDRNDVHVGLQEAFVDYHIRNVSRRFDFDSLRVGIQPLSTDFRGFLFQDNQLGFRLFGNRSNNTFQYNLGYFRRVDKDTNSGLNDVSKRIRDDDFYIANLYLQDMPRFGFTSQLTFVHNRNDEDRRFENENGFQERPAPLGDQRARKYNVTYLGYNGDGRAGRAALTVSGYYAFGTDDHNQLNGRNNVKSDIRAYFLAAEPSIDFDWVRIRLSGLYASGDSNAFDNKEEGFSAIFENPQFAGGDTSYWIRQGIPLIGGGGVLLTQRNGVLAELRTSKEHGQSNFNNPGVVLIGTGADFDLTPEWRLSTNINHLQFANTSNLETLRNQGPIDEEIGLDTSVALIWRPTFIQNVVLRLSGAVLFPGPGLKDLFASNAGGDDEPLYSILLNGTLTY
ncbi:MAG: hypothetical protein FJX65_15645 [Alphaproteobacteria bacterium]|nr:hypothetical protein [Alphaproteobacteria bacterium]